MQDTEVKKSEDNNLYVVARSGRTKRPMCQHIVVVATDNTIVALCGQQLVNTSSQYTDTSLDAILCNRCMKRR